MKKSKGFTLVELLVVIAIIAVLSSVIIANLQKARSKSRDTKRIAEVSQLQLALALYLNAHGAYPQGDSSVLQNALVTNDHFLPAVPTDPVTNIPYGYGSDGGKYCISAVLENPSPYIDQSLTASNCTTDGPDGTYVYRVTK